MADPTAHFFAALKQRERGPWTVSFREELTLWANHDPVNIVVGSEP
jgi:hypothetical protein